jgi:replicative DNA helicase
MPRGRAEQRLLAEAVERGSLDFLFQQNFNPNFFQAHNELAHRIWQHHKDYKTVPSRERLEEEYPHLDWNPPSRRDLPEYADGVRTAYVRMLTNHFIRQLIDAQDEWMDPVDVQGMVRQHFNATEAALNPNVIEDWTTSPSRVNSTIQAKEAHESGVFSVPFSHPGLNDYLGGMQATNLYVYVARMKIGKTFLSVSDSHGIWKGGTDVLYVSVDMVADQIGWRLDALEGHFSTSGLMRGDVRRYSPEGRRLSEDSVDHYKEYFFGLKDSDARFHILTRGSVKDKITPEYIQAKAADLGVGFVCVDYMGRISTNTRYTDRRDQMRVISTELKEMASDLGIPVLSPYQINREGEKGDVTLANFADSDDVARDIDAAISIHKEPFDDTRPTEKDLKETGSYLVTLKLLGMRHVMEGAMFTWNWNFDNGVRHVPMDMFGDDTPEDLPSENGHHPEEEAFVSEWARRGR